MRYIFPYHGIVTASYWCESIRNERIAGPEDDTYSYMTILTASFSKLSPNMMVYNFGSTLYWLKMARIVTGSVADRVEPKIRHSIRDTSRDSSPRNE
jgi:hypothetical protein